jgi:hypothetical protein
MFSLSRKLEDSIEIDGMEYRLDLAFDNVLLVFEMLEDENINEMSKVITALDMLFIDGIPNLEQQILIYAYKSIMQYLAGDTDEEVLENRANESFDDSEDINVIQDEKFYDLQEDAEYIYASFLYDYNIDLFEMQGKLHWKKFTALLTSLSDETMFKKVIDIRRRQIPTDKSMTQKEKTELRKQKQIFALKTNRKNAEFDAMDMDQKEEWARKQLEKAPEKR